MSAQRPSAPTPTLNADILILEGVVASIWTENPINDWRANERRRMLKVISDLKALASQEQARVALKELAGLCDSEIAKCEANFSTDRHTNGLLLERREAFAEVQIWIHDKLADTTKGTESN
jgi:hypothetical protein